MNENRIFKRYYIKDFYKIELDKITLIQNFSAFELVNSIENYPKTMYSDNFALNLTSEKTFSEEEKIFKIILKNEISLEDADVLTFGFNSQSDCNFLKLKLISKRGYEFETTITLSSNRWSDVIIDISNFQFREDIKEIYFSLFGDGKSEKLISNFQFSDIRFGNIIDFNFKRGLQHLFFKPQNKIYIKDNALIFSYKKGDKLVFPELLNSRYSELYCPFKARDTIKIIMNNSGDSNNFKLNFSTNQGHHYSTNFIYEKKCVLIPIDIFSYDDKEYLNQIEIEPLGDVGSIQIFDLSFESEKDFIADKDALFYLERKLFRDNPYAFLSVGKDYYVKNFGAKGDGFANDTNVIQNVINVASNRGGGRVILEKNSRYIVSHLELKSGIEFVIEEGCYLIQSENEGDYPYKVLYEHDNIYSKVNWAHNFLVNNKPLLYINNAHNVKINGGGKIRMMDRGSEEKAVGFPYWPISCGGTIHIAPIGVNNSFNIEIKNLQINRAGTYHLFLVHSQNIFISNLKMFDVRCLSADGIGISDSKNILIFNSFILTNDDGVTLCSMYNDPRSTNSWWKSTPNEDNRLINIEVDNCYINSSSGGSGKAISFIPWGTDAKDISKQEIDGVYVHNSFLKGGFSIGAWADNPYMGKVPFDNTETDDYSPVKNIRLENNDYQSPVSLECILATFVSGGDSLLKSSIAVVNGDFKRGLSNWNEEGLCFLKADKVLIYPNSKLFEGLWGVKNENKFIANVTGKGALFIQTEDESKEVEFDGENLKIEIKIELSKEQDIFCGVKTKEYACYLMSFKKV